MIKELRNFPVGNIYVRTPAAPQRGQGKLKISWLELSLESNIYWTWSEGKKQTKNKHMWATRPPQHFWHQTSHHFHWLTEPPPQPAPLYFWSA